MPTYYEIAAAHARLALKEGKGSASFTVRYVGNRRTEARAIVVPMEGAEKDWLEVEPPDQRHIEPGQAQAFKVNVAVPAGTSPGRYGLRLDVLSVDNPDEEYDRGPLVTLQVEESEEPGQQPGLPWRWVILAAVLLALIVGGAVWWANRGPDGSGGERPVRPPPVDPVPVDPRDPVLVDPVRPELRERFDDEVIQQMQKSEPE